VSTPRDNSARRFGTHATVYLVSSLLVRGSWVLLTPLYTRMMSPRDFAVVAVANSVIAVLNVLVGLSAFTAIPRLYFDHVTDEARRKFLGSIVGLSIVVPVGVGVLLETLGVLGALDLFEAVPFRPYLELVVWTSALSALVNVPITLFTTLEQPHRVSVLNIAAGVTQLALNILLVAVVRQGALGVLWAGFVSAALMFVVSFVVMVRYCRVALAWTDLRPVLSYALPLVPHSLATWALALSDRFVLARYVSPSDLGRYSLAYMLSTAVGMVAAAGATPITAAASRQLGDPETAKNVPPMGTYALLMTVVAAMLVSVNAPDIIRVLAPRDYEGAAIFVPWVVAGAALQGLYLVWSTGTWYSKNTKAIPVVTVISVSTNIALNVAFVPRYGAIVAAISTAVAYLVAAALHGFVAHRNHPIPWEYRRWFGMTVAAVVGYVCARRIALPNPLLGIVAKSLAASSLFVVVLALSGFGKAELTRLFGRLLPRSR
jgi:O-antigen/teichoic acid export membrane protein